jgi:hypothetical protein
MIPRRLNRSELALSARSTSQSLAAGRVESLPAEVATQFADELESGADRLADLGSELQTVRNRVNEILRQAQDTRLEVVKTYTDLKAAMRAFNASSEQYAIAGLEAPPAGRTAIKANAPTELAATGFSNGTNKLCWRGNNIPGSVIYHIEAHIDGKWSIIGTTTRQRFKHEDAIPGQTVIYRVYARSARRGRSADSNLAAVYK